MPAASEAAIDRPAAEAECEQLSPRHHAVLPRRQLGDHPVRSRFPSTRPHLALTWLLWFSYLMNEVSHVRDLARSP
jgi:hypothetical protein